MFSSARCEAGDERPPFPTLGEWFFSHATQHLKSRERDQRVFAAVSSAMGTPHGDEELSRAREAFRAAART